MDEEEEEEEEEGDGDRPVRRGGGAGAGGGASVVAKPHGKMKYDWVQVKQHFDMASGKAFLNRWVEWVDGAWMEYNLLRNQLESFFFSESFLCN